MSNFEVRYRRIEGIVSGKKGSVVGRFEVNAFFLLLGATSNRVVVVVRLFKFDVVILYIKLDVIIPASSP